MKTTTTTDGQPTITWVLETKFKDLTDDEIHQVFRDTWDATTNPNCVFTAFARAILRKAQEK